MTDPGTQGPHAAVAETAGVQRSIVSRRSLPNGRALVGALLVTIAAVGAFVFSTRGESGPGNEYLVLLRDVDAGSAVNVADLAYEPMTLSPQLADIAFSSTRTDTAAQLDGATALRFMHAGALLLAPDLRAADPVPGTDTTRVHELTLPVPLDRTPEVLKRGDRVTVLAYDSHNDASWTVVEDGPVLDYRTSSDTFGSSSHGLLTLALPDPATVVRSAHLSFYELTVVLTTRADDDDYPEYYGGPLGVDPGSGAGPDGENEHRPGLGTDAAGAPGAPGPLAAPIHNTATTESEESRQ